MRSDERQADAAGRFGQLIRERRRALGMRQEDLAMATGVGRRFVGELEAGKPTCQLGKALMIAEALSIGILHIPEVDDHLDLPILEDDDAVQAPRIL